jgi:hypothetical protein
MKTAATLLVLILAVTCTVRVHAADPGPTLVLREYSDVVAPSEQAAYEAGIKAYNQCLGEHDFKYSWTAWVHETGDTFSYSYTTDPLPWAAFDAMQAAAHACDPVLRSSVNPHLKSETSGFTETLPELSHLPEGPRANQLFLEVNDIKLKPGHEPQETFVDVMQKVTAAAEKTHWNYHYAISAVRDTGSNTPNFILAISSRSWAELGKEPETPMWAMVEKVYGKDDALALRKSLNDALDYETNYIKSYSAELSYKASSK